MRTISAIVTALALALCLLTFAAEEEKAPALETSSAKFSYALGLEIGASLKRLQTEIDFAALTRGVEDSLKGRKPLLTPQEAAEVKEEVFKKIQEERSQKMREMGEKNRKEGEAFLAENKKKKAVVTTPSGLQYTVLREGDGPEPKSTDRVRVDYRGTLLDGTEFDSSYKRGRPATFEVGGVIAGWTEALQLMKVGSKYRLFVPSNLAYGERGSGQIGPNATLIFDVELLAIEK
jgi:FKBP-type peptidyl-prolyl cis-trans isomerase